MISDVDRLRGFRIKTELLAEIDVARCYRRASEEYRAGKRLSDPGFLYPEVWTLERIEAGLRRLLPQGDGQVDYRLAGD